MNTADTHITTWNSSYTSNVAGNIQYTHASNLVTLNFPQVLGTVSLSEGDPGYISNNTALPTRLRPSSEVNCITLVTNGAGNLTGRCTVSTGGIITFRRDLDSLGFTNGSNRGFPAQSISYLSAIVNGEDNQS